MIEHKYIQVGAAVTWMLDWYVRWMLRGSRMPNIPEVRLLLRISWRKGFMFGSGPNQQKMRAIREQALAAVSRAWQHETLVERTGAAEYMLRTMEQSVKRKIYIADMQMEAEIETVKMGLRVALGVNLIGFAASLTSFALGCQVAGILFAALPTAILIRSLYVNYKHKAGHWNIFKRL
jgi:hypothetical protein